MTLRHLKIFVAVCQTGSATAAGTRLYLAQPAVSLAISELENYYGIRLFDRIGKRLHITEAGKHFLQYAIHIVDLFDTMEKEVRNFDAIGILRVGASVTIGNYLLPSYVAAFQTAHPQMKVHVIIDNSDTIQQHVLENSIDFGLIEGIVHSPYLLQHRFCDDALVLICGTKHAFARRTTVQAEEIQEEPFLLRERGSAVREVFDSVMLSQGMEIAPAWESTSTQAIVRAVKAGLGVSILPYRLVEENLVQREIVCFEVEGLSFHRSFRVIYHKNKFLTPGAKDFIALCK